MDDFLVDAHVLKRAVEHLAHGFFGDVGDGGLQVTLIAFENGFHLPEDHLVLVFAEGHDAAFVDARLAVGDYLAEVYLVDDAKTLAVRAGTLGGVE